MTTNTHTQMLAKLTAYSVEKLPFAAEQKI